MRGFLLTLAVTVLLASAAAAGTAEEWFAVACDAGVDSRRRNFAAERCILLADPSASIFIDALRDKNASAPRRQVALRILAALALPEAEAVLLETAFGPEAALAREAKTALAGIYARLPESDLYTLLTRGAREQNTIPGGAAPGEEDWLALSLGQAARRGAFKAIVMSGLARKYADSAAELPQPLVWQVREGLLDANPELRLAALRLLPALASPEATERLAGFLYTENDPDILRAALQVMAELRPPLYGEAVERLALDANPAVALEACAALDAMGYPGGMFPVDPGGRSVAGFATHPSTPLRRRAIELLAASGRPEALDYLTAALFDRVGANRALAARALGETGLTAAIGPLSPLLRDSRPDVRREAAVALARLGVLAVAAGVIDDLKGGDDILRAAAAEALGRIGDARAVPALLAAAGRGGEEARLAAVEALGALAAREAGEGLLALARGTDDSLFTDAVRRALSRIFHDDPGADAALWDAWLTRVLTQGEARHGDA